MAKGDTSRVSNEIDSQGQTAQNSINNSGNANVAVGNQMRDYYTQGANSNLSSYDELMNNYRNFNSNVNSQFAPEYAGYQDLATNGGGAGFDASPMNDAIAGYRNFAQNGGFSDQNIQDLRARATSPVRSAYAEAQANIDRQRALQGGYSPNYTAAAAQMARQQGQAGADAMTNANASIAQMVQQGKLAGLTGMSTTGLGLASATLQANQINNQMKLAGLGGMSDIDKARLSSQLAGMSGQNSLYSATPGLASTFGNQVLNNLGLQSNNAGLQNNLANIMIQGRLGQSKVPSNMSQGLGNASQIMSLAGQGLKMFGGGGSPGGFGDTPGASAYPSIGNDFIDPGIVKDPYGQPGDYNPGYGNYA